MQGKSEPATRVPALGPALARRIVTDATARYFRKCRSRVPRFVDQTFALRPALALHKHALGHDLWRAPLNTAMMVPQLGLNLAAKALRRAGRAETAEWLASRELFFKTSVAQAIERKLFVELLELPYSGPLRPSHRDALAEEILADPRLPQALAALEGPWGQIERERIQRRLEDNIAIYLNSRTAAAEIANAFATLGIGAALLHQATPGVLTFGPALAQLVANHIAYGAIPGGGVAAGLLPAIPKAALVVGTTGAVLAASAAAAAFSGIVTDPAQRALGLHHRRLVRLLDALEAGFRGDDARLSVKDHYAARLLDLVDAMAAAWTHARVI